MGRPGHPHEGGAGLPRHLRTGREQPGAASALLADQRPPELLAERVFCPWPDFEHYLRRDGIPLYGLETRHPLAAFDIIGFSLPYEQLYTNVLTMLDLAGLPLRAAERTAAHPLVIAGGSGCYNPEPMSAFFDAMVIGEGEEVIFEVIAAYEEWRLEIGDWRLGDWEIERLGDYEANLQSPISSLSISQSPNLPISPSRHALWTRLAAFPASTCRRCTTPATLPMARWLR
jgi:hypothetical protein